MSDPTDFQGPNTPRPDGAPQLPKELGTPFRPGVPHASPPPAPAPSPAPEGATAETTRVAVVDMIKTCYDPEIPVDIYELGLIYGVEVNEAFDVTITMTLTSPMCPVAEILPAEVEGKVRGVPGVASVSLELVWEPPWEPSMMSEAARLDLGF